MESTIPFIKDKVRGVLIRMPANTNIDKYNKLLSLGLKKSYLKIFTPVMARYSENSKINQLNNYMFLNKRGSDPNKLFKTSVFKKNYTFGYLDTEFLDTVKPKTFQKDTVSMKPDKKFAFGKMEIDMLDTVDVYEPNIDTPKKYSTQDLLKLTGKPVIKPSEGSLEYKKKEVDKLTQEKLQTMKDTIESETKVSVRALTPFKEFALGVSPEESPGCLVGVIIGIRSINGLTNDKNKQVPFSKMKEHIEFSVKKASNNIRKFLVKSGIFDINGNYLIPEKETVEATNYIYSMIDDGKLNDNIKSNNVQLMDIIGDYVSDANLLTPEEMLVKAKTSAEKELGMMPANSSDLAEKHKRTTLEMKVDFKSMVPGFEGIGEYGPNELPVVIGQFGIESKFKQVNEDINQKIKSVNEMPEVAEWLKNKTNTDGFKYVKSYTSSYYKTFNAQLKDIMTNDSYVASELVGVGVKSIINEFIENAPALERGIWVYRNGRVAEEKEEDKIEAGKLYTNAPIMSVTVSSVMTMGSSKCKQLIYLPAGTRCFPMFDMSNHSHENEIILPPMSTFKILDCWDFRPQTSPSFMVKSVYIGSAVESLSEKIKNKEIAISDKNAISEVIRRVKGYEKMMIESNNKEKNEENTKWDEPASMEFAEKLMKLSEKGDVKINMDFGKKKK